MKDWVLENTRRFQELERREITAWRGFELTLRKRGADGFPLFDPGAPARELLHLELVPSGGPALRVVAGSEHGFGLCFTASTDGPKDEPGEAGSPDTALSLPTGVVERVRIFHDEQTRLKRVLFRIAGTWVELVAGELVVGEGAGRVLLGSEEALLVRELPTTEE